MTDQAELLSLLLLLLTGWMNDPHGMFEVNGTTHVFMQYNPRAIQWGELLVHIVQ
jgi:hypothetical protein